MHLMIDIETLGIKNDAPVISLGAVLFNSGGMYDRFYICFDVEQQIDSGKRKVDGSTIKWWMDQEGAAKKVFSDKSVRNEFALKTFAKFYNDLLLKYGLEQKDLKVWGNGPTFDMTIMESLYQSYGMKAPWGFREIRDFRTFKEFVYDGSNTERVGTHHNALDDAEFQAQVVIDGMNGMGNKPESEEQKFSKKMKKILDDVFRKSRS
jgi:hypothetical protein